MINSLQSPGDAADSRYGNSPSDDAVARLAGVRQSHVGNHSADTLGNVESHVPYGGSQWRNHGFGRGGSDLVVSTASHTSFVFRDRVVYADELAIPEVGDAVLNDNRVEQGGIDQYGVIRNVKDVGMCRCLGNEE